jgi:hypothetical protein
MLDPDFDVSASNPFCLTGSACSAKPLAAERLHNLAQFVRDDAEGTDEAQFGTSRMIRIYQDSGKEATLIQRLDWELPPMRGADGEPAWINNDKGLRHLKHSFDTVSAVVLKDLGKGVVCEALVDWLARNFHNNDFFL